MAQLLFVAVGLLLVVVGLPLASRRIPPDRWYGFRVPATLASEKSFWEGHSCR